MSNVSTDRLQALMKILKAGLLYFTLVFGAGFILGFIRVLWIVPRFGIRMAELMEAPIMIAVLALSRCFSDPTVLAVLVDPLASNTRAHRFYKRLGFQFVEQRQFGNDDCFVYRLNRADWISESAVSAKLRRVAIALS